jgi:hypothetical protein
MECNIGLQTCNNLEEIMLTGQIMDGELEPCPELDCYFLSQQLTMFHYSQNCDNLQHSNCSVLIVLRQKMDVQQSLETDAVALNDLDV